MSYASQTREELARLPLRAACCARAEAAGMLNAGGVITLSGSGLRSVYIAGEQAIVIRRAFRVLLRAVRARAQIEAHRHPGVQEVAGYRVLLRGQDAEAALALSGLADLGTETRLPKEFSRRPCCRRAFLRGAFLVCGTLAAPEKGYHMEWRLARRSPAEQIAAMLREEGAAAGLSARRERHVVYLKEAEAICGALAMMGAVDSLLELENVRVVKELRNYANRQVNCESANADKTTEAAYRQLEALASLERRGALRALSPALRATAEARAEYPEATLEDLAHMLNVGKSAVNHRLRRLVSLSQSERRGND